MTTAAFLTISLAGADVATASGDRWYEYGSDSQTTLPFTGTGTLTLAGIEMEGAVVASANVHAGGGYTCSGTDLAHYSAAFEFEAVFVPLSGAGAGTGTLEKTTFNYDALQFVGEGNPGLSWDIRDLVQVNTTHGWSASGSSEGDFSWGGKLVLDETVFELIRKVLQPDETESDESEESWEGPASDDGSFEADVSGLWAASYFMAGGECGDAAPPNIDIDLCRDFGVCVV